MVLARSRRTAEDANAMNNVTFRLAGAARRRAGDLASPLA
jgi:hypothetical protein